MKTIVLIGVGQLGSRHLQALKNVNEKLNIYVIDYSKTALLAAKERYDSYNAGTQENILTFSQNINAAPLDAEIAIIASGSKPRKEIVERMLECTNIKYLVLEKLLFSNTIHLDEVEKLLDKKAVKTWVNCSMRMTPIWREIKNSLVGRPIKFTIKGMNYGLITNLIHYLDYMVYLTGCSNYSLNLEDVYKSIYESKRIGYKELMGKIVARFDDGSLGIFECVPGDDISVVSEISSENEKIVLDLIREKGQRITEFSTNSFDFHIPYQSELTTELVNSIITAGDCELPQYSISAKTHRLMMEPIIKFLSENTNYKEDSFPFT